MDNVVCLFDYTGNMGQPWAENGYHVECLDIQHKEVSTVTVGKGTITYRYADLLDPVWGTWVIGLNPVFLAAFPPCTDLAVSGARHFSNKAKADPQYRDKAMSLVYASRDIAELTLAPYIIENPISVISSEWRKPDFMFDPCDYGGYLGKDEIHPEWPDMFPVQDAYTKRTCYWTGNGYTMPPTKPVETISVRLPGGNVGPSWHAKSGGKSLRTKNIRSATPRGVARAIYQHLTT